MQSTYEAKDFAIAQKEAQQLELEIYGNATSEVGRNASSPRTITLTIVHMYSKTTTASWRPSCRLLSTLTEMQRLAKSPTKIGL